MDETRRESIKPLIHAWMQERLRALQDQVLLTWEEGMGRLKPDEVLLGRILELAGAEAKADSQPPLPNLERSLGVALDLLEHSNNQGEVLRHLLEGLKPFVERSAVFVVKPGNLTFYAQRGFELDVTRPSSPVAPSPELDDLIEGRLRSISRSGPAYKALLDPLSQHEAPEMCILPLCLRQKTVGLLMVDSGQKPHLEAVQVVRALTRATEAALSHQAASREEKITRPPAKAAEPAEPPHETASTDHTGKTTAPVSPQQIAPVVQAAVMPPNVNTVQLPVAQVMALDPKVRANAERSARVLIGDIELYSPAKVASGKTQRNLYGLLKDELERSRASFVDRYGPDIEEQHHVFFNTLVQQLCDGDPSRLGPNPWVKKTR